jgi:hypothetical protein
MSLGDSPMATVINDTEHLEADASFDGERWLMAPSAFETLTGWTLKPEGLCRDDVCAPLYRRDDVVVGGNLDLAAAAPIIGMTAVVDTSRGIAALAPSAQTRTDAMTTLEAPDFTLPNLAGEPVSLHDFDRRKVLLLAWSSW